MTALYIIGAWVLMQIPCTLVWHRFARATRLSSEVE